MGIFSKYKNVQDAKVGGGGVYIGEGQHTLKVVKWSGLSTRTKGPALVVDFEVLKSTNETHKEGSIRNYLILLDDDMGPGKARQLLIAASGLQEGSDSEEIEKTDWLEVLEMSVTKPLFVGTTVECNAPQILKKAGKTAAKNDPTLLDDADWFRKNSFTRLDFSPTVETRAKLHGKKGTK